MEKESSANHAADIVSVQRAWFNAGITRDLGSRIRALKKLRQLLRENEHEIAAAVYSDFGKSYYKVMENELGLVYAEISYTLRRIRRWSRPLRRPAGLAIFPARCKVYAQPYGNTLVISPWNYPVQLALVPVVSALAAGNTVILKPSEVTANTSGLLERLINQTFEQGLFKVVGGGVPETTTLLEQRFDKIFFTGSSRVGKIVMKAAAVHLTPVTLELGGKNPVIVLPDCNMDMSVKRIVWGKFHNGGQACVSADHIYVHASIYERFRDMACEEITRMSEKSGKDEIMPRIIDQSHYDRIMALVDQEKVVAGGKGDRGSLVIEPTVMTGVKEQDKVMHEEIFGPVMPLLAFDNLEQLLSGLEVKPSPLALYVFTRNIKKARDIHMRLRSGGGMINDTVVHFVNHSTPFGGIGESGMGSYHGRTGFEAFTHRKTVITKPTWFELWVKHPPYTAFKLKVIKTILK